MIAPIGSGPVEQKHFDALVKCEEIAKILAEKHNGEARCSHCGTVQFDDMVILSELSEEDEVEITSKYPFVSVRRPLF